MLYESSSFLYLRVYCVLKKIIFLKIIEKYILNDYGVGRICVLLKTYF